ncbi:MAG: DNA methyltransferase [Gemmataceae bacterium]
MEAEAQPTLFLVGCPKSPSHCLHLVERFSEAGCLVVDPFCGTGSIPMACRDARRNRTKANPDGEPAPRTFIGIDQSEQFCQMARENLALQADDSAAA